jgi:hypothetical protein
MSWPLKYASMFRLKVALPTATQPRWPASNTSSAMEDAMWFVIMVGAIGYWLDVPVGEIIACQLMSGCIWSIGGGIREGLAVRRAMRREG